MRANSSNKSPLICGQIYLYLPLSLSTHTHTHTQTYVCVCIKSRIGSSPLDLWLTLAIAGTWLPMNQVGGAQLQQRLGSPMDPE